MRPRLAFTWTAVLLAGCAGSAPPGTTAPELAVSADQSPGGGTAAIRQVDSLADEYFQSWVQTFPLFAVFSGVPDVPNDRLWENSLAAARAWERLEDRWFQQVKQIRTEPLRGRPEEATYGILRETLEASRQTRVCHGELWRLDQQNGWQIYLPIVAQLQPLGTPRLRSEALARWRVMPRLIDTEIVNLREGLRRGYTQPRANAQAVLQ